MSLKSNTVSIAVGMAVLVAVGVALTLRVGRGPSFDRAAPGEGGGAPDPLAVAGAPSSPPVEEGTRTLVEERVAHQTLLEEPPLHADDRRDVWLNSVEPTAKALLHGSIGVAEIASMAALLVDEVEPSDGYWSSDGTLTFDLMNDPEYGAAALHVTPGREHLPGEFDLRISAPAENVGWEHGDAGEAKVRFLLGFDQDGNGLSCAALTQTELETGLEHSHTAETMPPFGAELEVNGEQAVWRPIVSIPLENGRRFELGEAVQLDATELSGPRMSRLGGKLQGLRPSSIRQR